MNSSLLRLTIVLTMMLLPSCISQHGVTNDHPEKTELTAQDHTVSQLDESEIARETLSFTPILIPESLHLHIHRNAPVLGVALAHGKLVILTSESVFYYGIDSHELSSLPLPKNQTQTQLTSSHSPLLPSINTWGTNRYLIKRDQDLFVLNLQPQLRLSQISLPNTQTISSGFFGPVLALASHQKLWLFDQIDQDYSIQKTRTMPKNHEFYQLLYPEAKKIDTTKTEENSQTMTKKMVFSGDSSMIFFSKRHLWHWNFESNKLSLIA
ncbi:MAG: hypothetical protein OXC40_02630, partial [Proteobacteria bacterium]|nr:hypothetical protein [Pseudomonadota bacterium]